MKDEHQQRRDQQQEQLSPRQLARRKVKEAGRRSSEAAHTLMQMPEMALRHIDLEEELRDAFLRARKIPQMGARRREQRRLAGVLRQGDLDQLEQKLTAQDGAADARLFKQVEAWRTRLIEDGKPALEQFHQQHPGLEQRILDKMVHEACREQQYGKPRGAKKALFGHLATILSPDPKTTDRDS